MEKVQNNFKFLFFHTNVYKPMLYTKTLSDNTAQPIQIPFVVAEVIKHSFKDALPVRLNGKIILLFLMTEALHQKITTSVSLTASLLSFTGTPQYQIWFVGENEWLLPVASHLRRFVKKEDLYYHHGSSQDELYEITTISAKKRILVQSKESICGLN